MTARETTIEVSDLHHYYGDFHALRGISFEVHRGEIVGFLGPNGAGKSTTMKVLTCFMAASSGAARVLGRDVYEESLQVREKIGYLPESVPLYEDMLVYDYLTFMARMRGVAPGDVPRRVKYVIDVCGVSPVVGKSVAELSKGFRQRVGLAQALVHDPEVLILDEPTSGLDPNQIVDIRKLIREIGKEKTVLLSTHILQEIAALCDRILVIARGEIVADGSIDALLEKYPDARDLEGLFRLLTGGPVETPPPATSAPVKAPAKSPAADQSAEKDAPTADDDAAYKPSATSDAADAEGASEDLSAGGEDAAGETDEEGEIEKTG